MISFKAAGRLNGDHTAQVQVTFTWHRTDPLAVTIGLLDVGKVQVWTVSRDGLWNPNKGNQPAIDNAPFIALRVGGDVVLRFRDATQGFVSDVYVSARLIRNFLDRIGALLPPDEEAMIIEVSIEAAIAAVLAEGYH